MDGYFDLGNHSFPIATSCAQTQRWFDRGLIWVYGFNHEEAAVCFRKAAELDPHCAMAQWGIAYASGPFYNMPWDFFSPAELSKTVPLCHDAITRARALSAGVSELEGALIEATARRFQSDAVGEAVSFRTWDDDFAAAMRRVQARFPEHPDITALAAEALITRTPWKLWDLARGTPAEGADSLEAIEMLEAGMNRLELAGRPPHPGILHIYIHALEMSPWPERALKAADALRDLVPDSGHLHHMPSHIYVLCGLYHDALQVSEKAIAADRKYLAYAGPKNFYTTSRCHDFHLMMYAAMFLGRYESAREAAEGITQSLPPELLAPDALGLDKPHMAMTLEGYYSMCMHAEVRFGRWREILAAPLPKDPALYPVTTAMYRYARGVAYAALGDIAAAEAERRTSNLRHRACRRPAASSTTRPGTS